MTMPGPSESRTSHRPRVLVIIQNLWIPLDRRVWLECHALMDAGYDVSVICPRGPELRADQVLDGIRTRTYRPPPVARGTVGFFVEFLWCWMATAWLAIKAWRAEGFDVMQACNPPDTFFALAWWFQRFGGVRFVYDQHDLCPELFESRFPTGRTTLVQRVLHRGLLMLEYLTYRTADHVIATNGSYEATAMRRGRRAARDITIVRSGPDPERMRPVPPRPELKHGRRYLLAYLGVMGPQDGVDIALRAMDVLVHRFGRDDVHLTLMGKGDCYDELRNLAAELQLDAFVDFTGRASDALVAEVCSTADLGLSPDPRNPLNDVSTMNKTMEYMAFGLPVVAFDLIETRVSGGDAARYVIEDDVEHYAKAIAELLDDPRARTDMGRIARRRVETDLAWAIQAAKYVSVFDGLTRPSEAKLFRP